MSPDTGTLPRIVLVHGAWADGSSWSAVIEHLQADGYGVTAPQFAMTRLADDAARLPEDDFVNHFAADVDPVRARVMFAVQQPLHGSALQEVMGVPAWRSLPSWFLVADGDQAIPPDAQRQFAGRMGATTIEVPTNHVAMVSHPHEVLNLIKSAVAAVP